MFTDFPHNTWWCNFPPSPSFLFPLHCFLLTVQGNEGPNTDFLNLGFFASQFFFPTAHFLHLQGHVAAIPTYTPRRTWSLLLRRDGLEWWCYCDTSFSCRTMRLSDVSFIIIIILIIIFHNEQGVYIIQTSDSPSQASDTQFLYGQWVKCVDEILQIIENNIHFEWWS